MPTVGLWLFRARVARGAGVVAHGPGGGHLQPHFRASPYVMIVVPKPYGVRIICVLDDSHSHPGRRTLSPLSHMAQSRLWFSLSLSVDASGSGVKRRGSSPQNTPYDMSNMSSSRSRRSARQRRMSQGEVTAAPKCLHEGRLGSSRARPTGRQRRQARRQPGLEYAGDAVPLVASTPGCRVCG